ncbi:MAG: IS1634 family transposase [Deltaproteobacteria bacterium]|nr:IS1634 family transposase [Deltaproteobacteria bacterium]MBW1893373.1 IS1634 family transposase [Deltaproteobacteria bacterium]
MYVDASKSHGKYTRFLLRENYREDGKVKHRTIANLSHCSVEEIDAIKLALKHKKNLEELVSLSDITLHQGCSVGAVYLIYDIARQLGIHKALGPTREGKLALWQVIARVIDQGSRLSAVRLAGGHAACDILGLNVFNEDDLYNNLDWLAKKQGVIEDRLFTGTYADKKPELFLYDVTSSYFEGTCNELGAFGYNRDGKKGKRQIVIGLLCDEWGRPISIEVFKGNTSDTKTFYSQVKKVSERFGNSEITFVGDRGMIRGPQIKEIKKNAFHYITAITKDQIKTLLNQGSIQLELFDEELAEIEDNKGVRYILRRNPMRVEEIKMSRDSKLLSLERLVANQNKYLAEHPRAQVDVALRKVKERAAKLRISSWIIVATEERNISIKIDKDVFAEKTKLDGCYVLTTDLKKDVSKEIVHARYKDLAKVEWAFRTSKTVELEMRPIHVRLADRTRGHALIVMLAYRIVQELAGRWQGIDLKVKEGINELSQVCAIEMRINNKPFCNRVPEPRASIRELLKKADVHLPEVFSANGKKVATRKKLTGRRKNN